MSQKPDILLISKNQNLRDAGVKVLAGSGFSVHAATGLRDALSHISSEPIGLIICGQELENVSAIDFLTYIKNDPLRESIPIVFFIHSERRNNFDRKRAVELGANDIIEYPLKADDFIKRLCTYLQDEGNRIPKAADIFPTSFLPRSTASPTPEKTSEKDLRNALVSLNGKQWAKCRIIKHTLHGAMTETGLKGKQGAAVYLRYIMPSGPLIAKGRLLHILLGDQNRHMGLGINFRGNSNWHQIHTRIKTEEKPPPGDRQEPESDSRRLETASAASSPKIPAPEKRPSPTIENPIRPDPPIGIEVSRDSVLWMYGEIIGYDHKGASITTPILGKSGEVLFIRCTLPLEQIVLKSTIEKVTLNNFKLPAGMEVFFPEKETWTDIADRFSENIAAPQQSGSDSKETPTSIPDRLLKSLHQNSIKDSDDQDWAKTIAITQRPPKTESIKNQFYKSLIGKKLGSYEIVCFLSAGGMGGVFRGWDVALERDVAIKVISYELSSQSEFVEMFFKEARLVSRLNHPNIAHIYFIGNENGIVYYAMEYIQGLTLAQLMKNKDKIPTKQAVEYFVDTCKALDRVWREKIIHRDIKPANIMISEENNVKVLDFGVAQQQKKGAAVAEKAIVGSPPYLSPEMIRELPVDQRSDIYSLGATFYHVLGGSPPFLGDSLEDILQQHLDRPPTPLIEKVPALPSMISEIVQKMLAKNPEDRFQSYQEIIDALADVI